MTIHVSSIYTEIYLLYVVEPKVMLIVSFSNDTSERSQYSSKHDLIKNSWFFLLETGLRRTNKSLVQ